MHNLIDYINQVKKKYFPRNCGIQKIKVRIDLKPKNSVSASQITLYWLIKNKKKRINIYPVKCGIPRYSEKSNPDYPETKKFGLSIIDYHRPVDKILKNNNKYFPGKIWYSAVFGKF